MFLRILVFISTLAVINGCAAVDKSHQTRLPVSYAVEGTSTAVVGIAIDKRGFPKETVREIVLTPGQRVVFAGPDKFLINFKNEKSPNETIKYESKNGTIIIFIPKDILENPRFKEEFRKNNYLKFDYSIIINGKELDPPIIIKRDS